MGMASLSTATIVLLTGMSGAALAQTVTFMSQEGPDMWRASKLAGVAIYGPDNVKIGNVTDVIMDHGGKATAIIIGVGGFLGIGEKDVAIPYDTVAFTQERIANAANQPLASTGAPAATNSAMAPGLGTPATPNGNAAAPAAPGMGTADPTAAGARPIDNPSTAYPDHGVIALTAEQLKSAPSFQFAK